MLFNYEQFICISFLYLKRFACKGFNFPCKEFHYLIYNVGYDWLLLLLIVTPIYYKVFYNYLFMLFINMHCLLSIVC